MKNFLAASLLDGSAEDSIFKRMPDDARCATLTPRATGLTEISKILMTNTRGTHMKQILVTGGTGTLGRQLVQQLCHQGMPVGVLSTRPDVGLPSGAKVYVGDLLDPERLTYAVRDAGVIVHCASNPRDPEAVDLQGTKNLLQSFDQDQLENFVYVSIAGVDSSSYPYYRVKYEVENIIRSSAVPWSIVRATQFHDLVLERMIRPFDNDEGLPLAIPAGLKFQSIDVKDVANRLQKVAAGGALRSIITVGGPEILSIEDMARTYLRIQGRDDTIASEPLGGDIYELFRSGININSAWTDGTITWEKFLRAKYGPAPG